MENTNESITQPVMLWVIVSYENGLPTYACGPIDNYDDAVMYATENYPAGIVWRVVELGCPA